MNPSTNISRVRRVIASAIFGFLGLCFCIVATADPSAESRTVKFADLNLANPSDAHVLYRRIRAAAEVVCSYYMFATDSAKWQCVRDATADAVIRINQPALSAVYNANNKTWVSSSLVSRSR